MPDNTCPHCSGDRVVIINDDLDECPTCHGTGLAKRGIEEAHDRDSYDETYGHGLLKHDKGNYGAGEIL